MEEKIKAGDIVALKSDEGHNLAMTVEYISAEDKPNAEAKCIWFHPVSWNLESQMIYVAALEKVTKISQIVKRTIKEVRDAEQTK